MNEPFFREAEEKFASLLEDFMPQHAIMKELYRTEIENLTLYGYGIKGYILSMIEAAMKISNNTISIETIEKITEYGKELLQKPIELLDGVEETLSALHGKYKLVVATKGDLKDQHRKLHDSGLGKYFHHIEVMSDKQEIDYEKLIGRLDIQSHEFLMIGNSLKSDVLPVLEIGASAIHVPFHTTWIHEEVSESDTSDKNFHTVLNIKEVLPFF